MNAHRSYRQCISFQTVRKFMTKRAMWRKLIMSAIANVTSKRTLFRSGLDRAAGDLEACVRRLRTWAISFPIVSTVASALWENSTWHSVSALT
jgi:hypothetical protein